MSALEWKLPTSNRLLPHVDPTCNPEITQTLVGGSPWGSPIVRLYPGLTTSSGAVQTRLAVDGLRYSQGDLRAGGARALEVCLSLEGACPTLQQLAGGRKSHAQLE